MGWITRRIAGYITFAIVSAILGFLAVYGGYLSGPPTLATTCGLLILGSAFLVSLSVTAGMKRRDRARKAWEQNALAWQAYYAANERAWQEYYARMYQQEQPPRPP